MSMEDVFFKDRVEAGQKLADKLMKYKDDDPVVLALPRGGVVLGSVIAKKLNCPLDLIITRKIGHPVNPEYAIGAVGVTGTRVLNEAETLSLDQKWLEQEIKNQTQEAKRRRDAYLKGKQSIDIINKTAIIVDDGIATGLTMFAAIKEIYSRAAKTIVVAVPVVPFETLEKLLKVIDDVVTISAPDDFLGSVGAYYKDFPQLTDEEVIKIMKSK